jgi:uncharacterized hydrophobic protein (TIGR00271 family)
MIEVHITRTIFRESYQQLRERAKLDPDFLLLTVAAAIICAVGFRMNSASVIVGAMVISPLLYPVICLGAATCQGDGRAFSRAVRTFALGLVAAIAAAAAINLLHATTFRTELLDRLSASARDYAIVAFFSGLAGTYAFFSPRIHEAITGIAISVALIPPVVMLAIGLAERKADLTLASATIVLCNVAGIYLGSVVTAATLYWISRDPPAG